MRIQRIIAAWRHVPPSRHVVIGTSACALEVRLKLYQSFIATVESIQRRIDVVEFLDLADAIGSDPRDVIKQPRAIRR